MIVADHLREALAVRFPGEDFTPYFIFLESLPGVTKGNRHHVLPKEEFPEFAKDPINVVVVSPGNHLRAHYWLALCTPDFPSFQRVFFFMTNFRRYVDQISADELEQFATIYERGRGHQAEISRLQGQQNVENGHLEKIRELPQTKAAQRRTGLVYGQRNAENGLLTRIAPAGGRVQGSANAQNGHMAKIGRIQGRKAMKNGQLAAITTLETCSKGGRTQGRKNVRNGHMAKMRHVRWHVNRGRVVPDCLLCQ